MKDIINARVVEHNGSLTVLIEEKVFDESKNDWVVHKFPLSITKGTRRVGNATYGTFKFGKELKPKMAWKVIEAIEDHIGGERPCRSP